ncbi:MAG: UDP-N-acetylmuramate--L-alanine ligase, partial [Bryobacteraceae bacterium]
LYLLDIYAASEPAMNGVTSRALLEKIRAHGHRSAHYAATLEEGIDAIAAAAEPGDAIITLGAGNVSQAAGKIVEKLRAASSERREA